jgi:tRNA U34 5-carboxymethylaminomethyl modifying GTPase MnmE/TrmE
VIRRFSAEPFREARLATFLGGEGEPIDRGLYLTFKGPRSETGEDVVELHPHGGLLVPAQLLAALHAAGARPARPGEFTVAPCSTARWTCPGRGGGGPGGRHRRCEAGALRQLEVASPAA